MERWPKRHLRGKKRGPNPTDRAKQGAKWSLLTEGHGVPIGMAVDGANRNDLKMTKETSKAFPSNDHSRQRRNGRACVLIKDTTLTKCVCCSGDFTAFPHIRSRGEEAQRMKKDPRKARRWVVERTHSGMNRFRDILICWTKKPENFLAQLHLACAYITLGQCGLLG